MIFGFKANRGCKIKIIKSIKSISGDKHHQTEKFDSITYPFLESLGFSMIGRFYPLNFEKLSIFVFKMFHLPIVRHKDGFLLYIKFKKG